jgi:hypothetical protein
MLVVTYLGDLFRTSMVQGETVEQSVSASIGHTICWDCRHTKLV